MSDQIGLADLGASSFVVTRLTFSLGGTETKMVGF